MFRIVIIINLRVGYPFNTVTSSCYYIATVTATGVFSVQNANGTFPVVDLVSRWSETKGRRFGPVCSAESFIALFFPPWRAKPTSGSGCFQQHEPNGPETCPNTTSGFARGKYAVEKKHCSTMIKP